MGGISLEFVWCSDHVFVERGSPGMGYTGISISFAALFLGSLTSLPASLHLPEAILVSK